LAAAENNKRSFFRKKDSSGKKSEMSFVDHLEALRWHVVRSAAVWLVITIVLFIKIDWIFDNIIFAPASAKFVTYGAFCQFGHWLGLGDSMCMPPINLELQGNTVSGPFMAALSISMIGGLIIAFPYLIWELWKFIKPALSEKELKYSRGSIFWVSMCFFIGAAFGYYLLAPFTFNFLANFTLGTGGVYKYIPTLDDYIDTLNNIILGCGISFELPVFVYILAKIGIISAAFMRKNRKYAVLIILIIAAVITPSPDWTSQMIVFVPLQLLYEISVLIAARVDGSKGKEEKEEWS
jgi:sec-independent protein translocase protein TatC